LPDRVNEQLYFPFLWRRRLQDLKNKPGNTKGGSITVLLTSCLTGLETAV